jgi:CubicO group peptidase (beta-lactamase class C family)
VHAQRLAAIQQRQQNQGKDPDRRMKHFSMNKGFSRILLLWLICFPAFGANEDKAKKLDDFFSQHLENIASPGFSVAVFDKDGPVFSKGYGVEVYGQPAPMTSDSIMAIGSLTKSFTAMAILQLEEQGLLSVDDLITDHIPWFRSADKSVSDQITIRMMLTNTSGLTPSFNILTRNLSRSPDALEKGVKAISSYKATRKPGESYEYFNEGWDVLGLIIEEITGQRYEHYIAEHILQPLQMSRSSTDRAVLETLPVLTGHHAGIEPVPAQFIHVQGALPAGSGLYSTVNDLGNYLVALMNGGEYQGERVLTPSSIEKMWTPAIPLVIIPYEMGGTGEPAHYAMGYFVFDIDGSHYVGHGGEFRTMSSFALIDRDNDLAIALLYNTGSLYPYTNEKHYYAMIAGLRLWSGQPPSEFGIPRVTDDTLNDFVPDPETLTPLLGVYVSPSGKRMDIRRGGTEGLHAFVSDGIYPDDFDVDFANSTNVVLRNIMEAKSAYFMPDRAGNISSIRFEGEEFRRKSQVEDDSLRTFTSESSGVRFQLPMEWNVAWQERGFSAAAGEYELSGSLIDLEFSEWLESEQLPTDVMAPGEMRNGYFFQSQMTRDGNGRQRLAMHSNHRGVNYLFELTAPEGELTHAIISTLNPFLDSLELD